MAWLAIDAGTSVIKAVVFSDDGHELALARRPTAIVREQPGWSEQDMDVVWDAVVSSAREAAASSTEPSAEPIRGIAVTAQGDGCWLVDARRRPTGRAILWNDARAAHVVEAWARAGLVGAAARISGSVAYPGLMHAILAWLEEHAPERLAQARWALSCNGWLFAQLTGVVAADLSEASNPFSDVRAGAYSPALLALFGMERHAPLLPPIAAGGDVVGALTEQAAARTGLPAGIPVVMAPYDIVCTAYGAGAAQPGEACLILGTTLCPEVFTASLDLHDAASGTTVALGNSLFLRAMPTLTGCEALEWAARMLGLSGIPALDTCAALASASPRGGVFFLPYLAPAGERSPFLAPDARGSFHGLTLAATRGELARAVYEGLSFAIRECLEAASPEPLRTVRVCGGGAVSDFWCAMLADVLGIPVLRSPETENGARGAHLFALAATGEIPTIQEGVLRFLPPTRAFSPNLERHMASRERFAIFKQLRDAARAQWRLLA